MPLLMFLMSALLLALCCTVVFCLVLCMLVGYPLLFGLLTWQDTGNAREISYTEFQAQVEARNVAEIFARGDSIEGELRTAAPVSEESSDTYQQFTTERPTFAQDDLLAELADSDATVSATPVVEERGTFLNLLISFAPFLLLIGFWVWLFRRQARGGGLFGGGAKKKPVAPDARDLRYKLLRVFRKALAGVVEAGAIESLVESVPGIGLRLNVDGEVRVIAAPADAAAE